MMARMRKIGIGLHPKKIAFAMQKKYGWELKRVEHHDGDSDSGADCVFKGKQTSFWDMWVDHQDYKEE